LILDCFSVDVVRVSSTLPSLFADKTL
jgi:hypothetical protein